ncbi:SigE family RNA polymerase sigma factor [Solwaraspora sp. WMMD1047]|uniref:SigE family RNA polymerase sigma factor n=1 Tax=Solwaraspora sp. WMMD1047 TaxID=3016102 RepID=UPI002417293A|nr:SigE family RNA polymerase sigma factor [Solwaraspora sp. WMMD1047]MDG4830234.1 SigE family RNA polymerase sigma factor [Solwaraspora sp. WMMD1047]
MSGPPPPDAATPSEPPAGRPARWRRVLGRRPAPTDDEFIAFAHAAAPRLRRTAFLMCRDWHLAQDLTQITLTKTYVSWKRVAGTANVEAYTRKILLRSLLDHQRRRSSREISIAAVPEAPADPAGQQGTDLRLTLLDALGSLPERDRAIVVLRYWEDLSVETVAEVLGISTAVVKTQSARSLTRLRALLDDSRADLLPTA